MTRIQVIAFEGSGDKESFWK